jgi:hypothetical protein
MAAQSSPEKNPDVVPSINFGQLNSSGSADLASPSQKPQLNPPRPLDRIRIEEYRPRLNQDGLPPTLVLGPDGLRPDDGFDARRRVFDLPAWGAFSGTHDRGASVSGEAVKLTFLYGIVTLFYPAPR